MKWSALLQKLQALLPGTLVPAACAAYPGSSHRSITYSQYQKSTLSSVVTRNLLISLIRDASVSNQPCASQLSFAGAGDYCTFGSLSSIICILASNQSSFLRVWRLFDIGSQEVTRSSAKFMRWLCLGYIGHEVCHEHCLHSLRRSHDSRLIIARV
jgi:hypothetical protein